jgi:putative mRNA 3-end processing factor
VSGGRPLVEVGDAGLECPAGGFWIDPWRPVERAVITHAHADHARPGSASYLTSTTGREVLRPRLDDAAVIETLPWGERRRIGDVEVSLHPAGHLLGSAQVRVERNGEVWVVSGDYKTAPDRTCEPFEPVVCDVFITESTFGLPIYRWPDQDAVFDDVRRWWRSNATEGRPSVLFAYALGKAQRLLAGVGEGPGPVVVHGAIEVCTGAYRRAGIDLPATRSVDEVEADELGTALVLAPPSAQGSPWMRRFRRAATAFASGWMRVRGPRRRRAVDRGFVLSDHVDWPGLLAAVDATGAARIGVTHGAVDAVVRYLSDERGLDAWAVPTRFTGEADGEP